MTDYRAKGSCGLVTRGQLACPHCPDVGHAVQASLNVGSIFQTARMGLKSRTDASCRFLRGSVYAVVSGYVMPMTLRCADAGG